MTGSKVVVETPQIGHQITLWQANVASWKIIYRYYTLWSTNIAIENCHLWPFIVDLPIKSGDFQ